MRRRRRPQCHDHGHPTLRRPVSRRRVRRELQDFYHQAGFAGLVDLSWTRHLERLHQRNARRYAQVAPFETPPAFELAAQTAYLPARFRRALLAHEVGHALDPHGSEADADAAAECYLGVTVGYDRRWPGKGLQVTRNPSEHELVRKHFRDWQATGDQEAYQAWQAARSRIGLLPEPASWPINRAVIAARTTRRKRMRVTEAESVIHAWLRARDWRPDPIARSSAPLDAWISRSEKRRVTFKRTHVVFWTGRRGRWEKDYRIHRYGTPLGTIDFAERLIRNSQASLDDPDPYAKNPFPIVPIYPYPAPFYPLVPLPPGTLVNPDVSLRELERRWQQSGTYEDMAAYVSALERAGEFGAAALALGSQASRSADTQARQLEEQARLYRLMSLPPHIRAQAESIEQVILASLRAANGRRRERIEDAEDAWHVIRTASGPRRWSGGVSDTVPGSYGYRAWTSATLAVRPPRSRSVYFGAGVSPAHRGSLGRAWPVLQPWRSDPGRDPQLWEKLTAWVHYADVRIPNRLVQPVLDLLIEHYRSGDSRLVDAGHWIGSWREPPAARNSGRQRCNPDVDLREFERRWKETGSVEDHAAYLRALMRSGGANPAKLWILARMNAPERAAIELALSERIPVAPGFLTPDPLRVASSSLVWVGVLTVDISHELDAGQEIPLQRLVTRYEAWELLLGVVQEVIRKQDVAAEIAGIETPLDPEGMQREARLAAKQWDDPRFDREQIARNYVNNTGEVADAMVDLLWALFEGGAFPALVEIPQRWADEAFEEGAAAAFPGEELNAAVTRDYLEEAVMERRAHLGMPWLPEQIDVDLDRGNLPDGMLVLAYPNAHDTAVILNQVLLDSLRAWLREERLPEIPLRATFPRRNPRRR